MEISVQKCEATDVMWLIDRVGMSCAEATVLDAAVLGSIPISV